MSTPGGRVRALIGATLLAATACSRPAEDTAPAAARVHVVRPQRLALTRTITLSANVEAFEQSPVFARVSGYVDDIAVDIGDRVDAGQVLATLEIPEMAAQATQAEQQLAERRAEVARAQAEAALQRIVFTRSRGLRAQDAITEQALDEARARAARATSQLELARARSRGAEARVAESRALMQYATLRAPFAGVIIRRFVDRGALVQASTSNNSPLLILARTETLRVFVDVPEPDVPFVDRDDRVVLEVAALAGTPLTGAISRVAEALDVSSRTMRAEVDVPNTDGRLRPGMYGTLTIALETRPDALTIPAEAVRKGPGRDVVYVVEEGHAAERRVRTGLPADGRVEILEGVGDEDRVIASSSASVAAGVPVQVVEGAP